MVLLTKLKPEPRGVHNPADSYEVNSLVTSPDGARAYLSVQAAPAGVALEDGRYWVIHTDLTSLGAACLRSDVIQSLTPAQQGRALGNLGLKQVLNGLTDPLCAAGNPLRCRPVGGLSPDSLVTSFLPAQAATPSPEYPQPITGWKELSLRHCGVNLLDESTLRQGYYGTANSAFIENAAYRTLELNLPAGSYTLSIHMDETPFIVREIIDDRTVNHFTAKSVHSFTLDAPCAYTCVLRNTQSSESFTNLRVQLEAGKTATQYEPCRGETLAASLGERYYGGEFDWISGVLRVTWAYFYASSAVATYGTSSTGLPYAGLSLEHTGLSHTNAAGLCTHYPVETAVPSVSGRVRFTRRMVYVYDARFTDADAAMEILAAEQPMFAYPLETPVELQLDPRALCALQGENTFLGDGEITFSGRQDKAIALEARIAALEAKA